MNHLDYFSPASRPVEACVVGSGGFGRSFIAQGLRVPLMSVRVAVDIDAAVAAKSFVAVGVPAADVAVCDTADAAAQAWADGKYIAAADLGVVAGLPLDVVVEATGNPEAGARHGRLAIEAGHHVVLVSKEVDSVVGPYLAAYARQRGKVVTQPLLILYHLFALFGERGRALLGVAHLGAEFRQLGEGVADRLRQVTFGGVGLDLIEIKVGHADPLRFRLFHNHGQGNGLSRRHFDR